MMPINIFIIFLMKYIMMKYMFYVNGLYDARRLT